MLQLVGILLMTGQFSVAVEGEPGQYQTRTFACEAASMDPMFSFIEEALGPGEPAIQFVIGPIDGADACEPLFKALSDNGIGNAAVGRAELEAFTGPPQSGRNVAEAFRKKHARLFKR